MCQIQWIDKEGRPTPDTNPPFATAVCFSHGAKPTAFQICVEHVQRFPMPGWALVPLGVGPAEVPVPPNCGPCGGAGTSNGLPLQDGGLGLCRACNGNGFIHGYVDPSLRRFIGNRFDRLPAFKWAWNGDRRNER